MGAGVVDGDRDGLELAGGGVAETSGVSDGCNIRARGYLRRGDLAHVIEDRAAWSAHMLDTEGGPRELVKAMKQVESLARKGAVGDLVAAAEIAVAREDDLVVYRPGDWMVPNLCRTARALLAGNAWIVGWDGRVVEPVVDRGLARPERVRPRHCTEFAYRTLEDAVEGTGGRFDHFTAVVRCFPDFDALTSSLSGFQRRILTSLQEVHPGVYVIDDDGVEAVLELVKALEGLTTSLGYQDAGLGEMPPGVVGQLVWEADHLRYHVREYLRFPAIRTWRVE